MRLALAIAALLVVLGSPRIALAADCDKAALAEWDNNVHDAINSGDERGAIAMQALMAANAARVCVAETSGANRYSWYIREGTYYSVAAVQNMDAGNKAAARDFFTQAIAALKQAASRSAPVDVQKGAKRQLQMVRGLLRDLH